MHDTTSAGSSRCHEARVCFELAPTVTEKTWSSGSFVPRRARNISGRVISQAICEGFARNLTFIREVISRTEDELWRSIAVVGHKTLSNLTLVHKPRANFQVGLAGHDFDFKRLGNSRLEVLLALTSLEGSVLGVGSAVVPGQSDLFPFDKRACTLLDEIFRWI